MKTIGVLGGTGHEGKGLAMRWAKAGYKVVIGSRDAERAKATAQAIREMIPGSSVEGYGNRDAAAACEIAVLTVPYAAHKPTLEDVKPALQGKILVDVTVPLVPPKVARVQLPPEDSAAVAAQNLLGPDVKVVSAFQNLSSHLLEHVDTPIDCDVLVCGDDTAACNLTIGLIRDIGMRGLYAGTIRNSAAVEALTSVLIAINRRHKVTGSGIRITGLPEA